MVHFFESFLLRLQGIVCITIRPGVFVPHGLEDDPVILIRRPIIQQCIVYNVIQIKPSSNFLGPMNLYVMSVEYKWYILLRICSYFIQDSDQNGRASSSLSMPAVLNPPLPAPLPPVNPDLVDFTSSDLWNDATQNVVNDFRVNLQQWTVSFCPTCLRIHPFSQSRQVAECGHCKAQRMKGLPSRFGAENDMDPGLVHPF